MTAVIVTGAAKGIGKAIVKQLHNDGFTIHACDINQADLTNLSSNLGPGVSTYCFDMSKPEEIDQFYRQFNDNNRPSSLVNNAGIYPAKSIFDYSAEDMQKVIQTNLIGTAYLSKLFAKPLVNSKQQGCIINIGSVSEYGSSDAIYGCSKGAVSSLTRCCAGNFSPYIRVNAIAPGLVKTDMLNDVPLQIQKAYAEKELIKEQISPEIIAANVAFLLSEAAKHYSGAIFDLNNGVHRR